VAVARRWVSFALAGILLLTLAPPVAATHTAACSEASAVNRFSFHFKIPAPAPTGVRGTMENQALDVCSHATDDDRANLIWVSIDPNAPDPNAVFQAGRGNCKTNDVNDCDQVQMRWWSWGRTQNMSGCGNVNSVAPHVHLIANGQGTDQFIVARDGVSWEVFLNGFLEASVAQASVCWTKVRATWTGESWDAGDAIGGSAGNKYAVTSAAYQTTVAGAWLNPGFVAGANCPFRSNKYECVSPTNNSLSFWTDQ
jgi:hypothetical protein